MLRIQPFPIGLVTPTIEWSSVEVFTVGTMSER